MAQPQGLGPQGPAEILGVGQAKSAIEREPEARKDKGINIQDIRRGVLVTSSNPHAQCNGASGDAGEIRDFREDWMHHARLQQDCG